MRKCLYLFDLSGERRYENFLGDAVLLVDFRSKKGVLGREKCRFGSRETPFSLEMDGILTRSWDSAGLWAPVLVVDIAQTSLYPIARAFARG